MGPYEWALIFAVAGILAVGGWQWTRPADEPDNRAAWDASTDARTEDDVRADVTAWRARRTQPAVETEPGDPYSDDRINAELMFIPHARRTEEDQ